jgi:heterotetrameric sarcosine oxidase gamma subunit
MVKRTPLSTGNRSANARLVETAGWEVAEHFSDPEGERRGLESECVLVDWSHVGKISLRGPAAESLVAGLASPIPIPAPLRASIRGGLALLRLADDEFLILCPPGQEERLLSRLDESRAAVLVQTGGYGALLLAGPRRGEVLERSTAMRMSAEVEDSNTVVQTSVHFVPCTVLHTATWDLLIQQREYTESLHHALLDVGRVAGLARAGVGCMPVAFGEDDRR